jgi:hypothetical protein
MGLLNAFRSDGTLVCDAVIHGLPPRLDLIVNALVLRAPSANAPTVQDAHAYESVCVKDKGVAEVWPLRFTIRRPPGFYYVALSVIAVQRRDGKVYAQVERFFPMASPCRLLGRTESSVTLDVTWPDIPLDQLGTYGTVHPNRREPGSDA